MLSKTQAKRINLSSTSFYLFRLCFILRAGATFSGYQHAKSKKKLIFLLAIDFDLYLNRKP